MHEFRVIVQPEAQDDIIGYVDYLFFVKEVPETAMEIEAGIKGKILCVFSFRVKRCQILSACSSALRSKRTT